MYNVYENYIPGSSEKPKDTYDYSYDTGYEVIDVTKPMYYYDRSAAHEGTDISKLYGEISDFLNEHTDGINKTIPNSLSEMFCHFGYDFWGGGYVINFDKQIRLSNIANDILEFNIDVLTFNDGCKDAIEYFRQIAQEYNLMYGYKTLDEGMMYNFAYDPFKTDPEMCGSYYSENIDNLLQLDKLWTYDGPFASFKYPNSLDVGRCKGRPYVELEYPMYGTEHYMIERVMSCMTIPYYNSRTVLNYVEGLDIGFTFIPYAPYNPRG